MRDDPSLTPLDRQRLQQALALAEGAIGLSDPNPRVGCVLGRTDGALLGQGHTQRAGEAHAEVMALRDARATGQDLRGATAWVSLEPCSHYGRTPPCCEALIEAGVSKVVVASTDPNPVVQDRGLARLRAAGIEVIVADDDELGRQARDLNMGFFSRMTRQRPWVRAKMAASLDGVTALRNGRSQWITGPAARSDGHAWRKRAGAVVTGIGTVMADDPRLDVREVPTTLQPVRVVLDSRLRISPGARILQAPGRALVLTCNDDAGCRAQLEHAGAQVQLVVAREGRIDLQHALLQALNALDTNEAHVEAGPTLTGALVAAGLIDELLIYSAPVLLGPGRAMVDLAEQTVLPTAPAWRFIESVMVGVDVRTRAVRA